MEENNRPKLNLNALKGNKVTIQKKINPAINTTNNVNSVSGSSNDHIQTKIEKTNITQTTVTNKTPITVKKPVITSNIKHNIINKSTETKQNNNHIERHNTTKVQTTKTNIVKPIITDTKTNIINTPSKVEQNINDLKENNTTETKNIQNNIVKKENEENTIKPQTNDNKINNEIKTITKADLNEIIIKKEEEKLKENGEIFSGYTSDFSGKKEQALKESKKIKFPDSPKKIFFAIFTSLIILSSLVLIIIFKVDKPITNKLKTNILELVGKSEQTDINKKTSITWKKLDYNVIGITINYELSNTNKYRIDGKILNNKNDFNEYIKNKIEKLKIEKLKEHIKEEKVAK